MLQESIAKKLEMKLSLHKNMFFFQFARMFALSIPPLTVFILYHFSYMRLNKIFYII